MTFYNPYVFTNEIENIENCVRTRGVRVKIKGSSAVVQVSADKINDNPWMPPSAQIPQARITYDQWRDLTEATEFAFAEYSKRFENKDEKLVLLEETAGESEKSNKSPSYIKSVEYNAKKYGWCACEIPKRKSDKSTFCLTCQKVIPLDK